MDGLAEYLAMPCDRPDCEDTATHNQAGQKVCNTHLDPDVRAFARDD